MPHIGNKIKERVQELRLTVQEFATQIHKSRTVVYDIFERDTIDTGLLETVCKVLDYDFFALYTNPPVNQANEEAIKQIEGLGKEIEQLTNEIQSLKSQLKDKETINRLLEDKISLMEKLLQE